MSPIKVRPLRDDLPFGSRISGVTEAILKDEGVRKQINDVFEDRGLIVFEDVEPTSKMHVTISAVFGPLKDHPVKVVPRVDQDAMPGVIEMRHDPAAAGVVEIEGKQLAQWLPWHFDHCYNNELNRAGVLRALDIPPEGGMTGFADGIELYNAISPELLKKMEKHNIIYTLDLAYSHMRFGKPKTFREISEKADQYAVLEIAKTLPRAIHPAIWTRKSGEKVLHVSPWMAVGIEGHEDPEGDKLLETVCQEIIGKVHPYFHKWKPTDMLIWDNWRLLHSVSGSDPKHRRTMHRTTIKGDYGLGYFENAGQGHAILEMTV
ncbi:MAG: TauD/TfdA family dioxygenase [Rhodospirillaceae bacterium]|nr:MAG: TauD/TfdA family dioxygenase [Rhodospirillaceae bacterium]